MNRLTIPFLTLFLLSPLRAAELKLAAAFSDHMVLQRVQPVPVWGWADSGEKITVEFADQKKTAIADASGKWQVTLEPMAASAEPRVLRVQAEKAERRIETSDVLVGDVWLCSGQSNMHFTMGGVENSREEVAAANHPALRFFRVEHRFGQKPVADAGGAWKPISPTSASECSAVAYFFGRDLQQKLGVPIGLLVSSVGGTRIESWMRSETLAATGESASLVEKWRTVSAGDFATIESEYRAYQEQRDHVHPQAVKAAKAQGKPVPTEPKMPKERCHDCPSALHNGMIAPLQPFAIRGVIWYQGESNSGQPAPYEKLLPAMIADWRQVWGKEMPFLFVQLAPYRGTHPAFREAQHRIWQKTPRTAMVVTTDAGNPENIHPTRKQPVGARLALAARALSYGEAVEYSGPIFEKMSLEKDRAVLSFQHQGKGLIARGAALTGFTIAGVDGKFVTAQAAIEGSTVAVSSEKVTQPTAVRYGWAFVPDGNLFNREGLPAAPFRTDTPAGLAPAGNSK
jgi:sialate O-acetylesterase